MPSRFAIRRAMPSMSWELAKSKTIRSGSVWRFMPASRGSYSAKVIATRVLATSTQVALSTRSHSAEPGKLKQSSPSRSNPRQRFEPHLGMHTPQVRAHLSGVMLDVADVVDVQLAARELAPFKTAGSLERFGGFA